MFGRSNQTKIVIVGAGPSGTTLACLLALRGFDVRVFDNDKRPELLVGESLLPAVMPILRRLGIEDRIAQIAPRKYGAAIRYGKTARADFRFQPHKKKVPDHAFNIPRPEFELVIRERAVELGVTFVQQKAKVTRVNSAESGEPELWLDADSLQAAGLHEQPDLLIDATGRGRYFSRLLELPYQRGERDDVAYFAHYKNFKHDERIAGQIVISVLEHGWSWQIPLLDKLSVGVVVNKSQVQQYGDSPSERLENLINANELLAQEGQQRERLTKVMSYTNYQLISERAHGKGWALLGDAYGFVDPMLSSGVYMALLSADIMDRHVFGKGRINTAGFARYEKELSNWHHAWNELIQYFYNGRILGLDALPEPVNAKSFAPNVIIEKYIRKAIASMISGATTNSTYHQKLLSYTCERMLTDQEQLREFSVRS